MNMLSVFFKNRVIGWIFNIYLVFWYFTVCYRTFAYRFLEIVFNWWRSFAKDRRTDIVRVNTMVLWRFLLYITCYLCDIIKRVQPLRGFINLWFYLPLQVWQWHFQSELYLHSKLAFSLCGRKILICHYHSESRTNTN